MNPEPLPSAKESFFFESRASLTEITGRVAANLEELLQGLREVPGSVLYTHTHRFLQQHQYLSPEPPNDFAFWVTTVLQENALGERLAAIDTIQFKSLTALRQKLVQTLETYLAAHPESRHAAATTPFYFQRSITFVFTTPHGARDLKEFRDSLQQISLPSLFHHIFEARLRLEKGVNDFSWWLEDSLGEKKLAERIARLDPYTTTLEGLRARLIALVNTHLRELGHA